MFGSGNAAAAKLLRHHGLAPPAYKAHQGQEIGRNGEITVNYLAGGPIELGGATCTVATGKLVDPVGR